MIIKDVTPKVTPEILSNKIQVGDVIFIPEGIYKDNFAIVYFKSEYSKDVAIFLLNSNNKIDVGSMFIDKCILCSAEVHVKKLS